MAGSAGAGKGYKAYLSQCYHLAALGGVELKDRGLNRRDEYRNDPNWEPTILEKGPRTALAWQRAYIEMLEAVGHPNPVLTAYKGEEGVAGEEGDEKPKKKVVRKRTSKPVKATEETKEFVSGMASSLKDRLKYLQKEQILEDKNDILWSKANAGTVAHDVDWGTLPSLSAYSMYKFAQADLGKFMSTYAKYMPTGEDHIADSDIRFRDFLASALQVAGKIGGTALSDDTEEYVGESEMETLVVRDGEEVEDSGEGHPESL